MEISGDINQVDIALFCDQAFLEISNTSFFSSDHSRIYEHYDCQGTLPQTAPSSPPIVCNSKVECQIPITPFTYTVDCSVWFNRKCSSATEFLRAHNCSSIEVCAGCCLLDSPPPSLPPPPPPSFRNATEVDTEYPPWVFALSLSLLVGGLSLCTGILLYGNCFMIAKDILNYIDDTIESIRIPRKKIPKKTVPKMTNAELFTSVVTNEQKKPIRPPPTRPTRPTRPTTLNIAIPIPNIWPRALIADNSETQRDRADVTSEPLVRSSTNLETSRQSFSDPETTRRSSSVPKSRAHLRYRL